MYSSIISAEALLPHLHDSGWRIFDCRFSLDNPHSGRQEYIKAHIPGAAYIHLDDDLSDPVIPGKTGRHPLPSIADMASRFSAWGIGTDTQVVIYDHGHGGIAARLWWMLHWLGHEAAAVLDGGWKNWQSEGHPSTDVIPERSSRIFTPEPQGDWLRKANELEGDHPYLLVDARAAERYRGEIEPIDTVAGHIPGAINLPFAENLDEKGKWKSPEKLKERFAEISAPGKEAVFYCGSGVTACHNLLARYHGGLGMGKLYAGSWSDWITDKARPVAKDEGQ